MRQYLAALLSAGPAASPPVRRSKGAPLGAAAAGLDTRGARSHTPRPAPPPAAVVMATSLLADALRDGDVTRVKNLLQRGADPNVYTGVGAMWQGPSGGRMGPHGAAWGRMGPHGAAWGCVWSHWVA